VRRVGADIGGTFTDLILVDDATGAFTVAKSLTTPDDPSRAVETVLVDATARHGIAPAEVDQVIHGTTLVTNAIIERKGARTALLATAGFRDAVEIGKEVRFELYDLELELPEPVVPRYLRFDVPQRWYYTKAMRRRQNSGSIVTVASDGTRIALGGVAPRPVRATAAEAALAEGDIAKAAELSVEAADPFDDAFASAWYRRRVLPVHVRRALNAV